MKLWMSGEVQADIYEEYRELRKTFEHEINSFIDNKEYGKELKEWAYIAIIREEDSEDYDEVAKYSKSDKETEFRLKIDHDSFLNGSPKGRAQLFADSLIRSIKMMPEIGVVNVDFIQLEKDVSCCLSKIINKIEE